MASCDLNGNDFRVHFEAKTTGIFDSTSYVLEVHNGVLYYGKDQSEEDNDDPTNAYKRPIWMLDLKKENATAQLLSVNRTNWEQFRVYSDQSQVGTNACGDGRHNCSHLCVGTSNGGFQCLCPTGLNATDDGICKCHLDDELECMKLEYGCVNEDYDDFACDGRCFNR